uniref:GDSL-type esterase/lipase family protein n=1 Tax=Roseihalotalea indica TaxID=2867963 RepID=A0AA49JFF8_9BACT|nr:GDSL-type esterase/lipase family protein [Tunicatimonas sp. TK19036]
MKRLVLLLLSSTVFFSARAQLKSEDYIQPYGHLDNAMYRLKKENKLHVAFLGGSITHMKGWRDLTCNYLKEMYPEAEISCLDAGIPSLGSLPHAFRLQRDVLDKGPVDLLFIESAVNDKANGTPSQTQRRALEGIIRHAQQANPNLDMVLMAFVDPEKMETYRAGKIPEEVKNHDDLAKHYKISFINLAQEITDRIDAGEFTWEDDFKDLHPSPFGQQLYFHTIKTLLDNEAQTEANQLISKSLPTPLAPENYSTGNYLSVSQAKKRQGFVVTKNWQPSDSASTREGFVHVPVLESTTPGSSFTLDFEGDVIGIATISGPDAGVIEYTIDGKSYPPIDLYTQWSHMLHLPWYKLLADELENGKHTLVLKLAQSSSTDRSSALRIVYFLVNE